MVAEKAAIKASNSFTKIVSVSPALKKFLGVGESSRIDITKRIWAYAKENKLQNPENRREILCDDKLKAVFAQDKVTFAELGRLITPHLPKPEKEKEKEKEKK